MEAQKLIIDNQGHSGLIHDVAFIDQGKKILSVSEDKSVRVWDVSSGTLAKTYRFETEEGVYGKIYASALSKDERYLFLGGYFDASSGPKENIGEIRILDLVNEKLLPSLKGHQNVILDLVVSEDGSKLISASADQSIIVWDLSPLKYSNQASVITSITDIASHINAIDFDVETGTIAAGDQDGYVRTWSLNGGNPSQFKVHSEAVRDVKFSPHTLYSAGEDGRIIKWTKNGKYMGDLAELPGAVNVLEVSQDGNYLTAMGRVGIVYSLASEMPVSHFDYHTNAVSAITSAPFSTFGQVEGQYMASAGGDDKNILLWEIKSAKLERNFVGKGKSVFGIGINEDNQELAFSQTNLTGVLDDVVLEKAFDLNDFVFKQTLENPANYHRATTQSGDQVITKESSNSIAYGARMIHTDERRDGTVRSFTFMQEGQSLAIGSSYTLLKYSTVGEELLGSFKGHEGEVWALADYASENLLLSASNDQTIKIWNNTTGENLASLFVSSDNEWVIWTPQGFYEASAGGEKYIGWHINKGRNNLAEFHDVSAFRNFFHKPEVIHEILKLKSFEKVSEVLDLDPKEEKITPPTIDWITEPNTLIEGRATTVRFSISSQTPVTQLKLMANGRPLISRSELSISGNGHVEQIDWEVEIPEGSSETIVFSVFAQDQHSKILSTERSITFVQNAPLNATPSSGNSSATPPIQTVLENTTERSRVTLDPVEVEIKKSNLYMVSIGVSEFSDPTYNLKFADDDANAIDELFKNQKGKMFNSVTSLKLTNQDATRAKILKTFQRLEQYTTVDDFVIIFIASHGINEDNNFYILPHDGDANNPRISCIDWRDFSDLVGNMSAKVVLFIDTCHSGQLGNNIGQKRLSNTEAVRELSGKEYGVVIMAAATGYEYSLEHDDWGHGAFTLSILEGLQDGKADIKPDGTIHLRELDYYLSERVQELTGGRQHPTTQKPSSISKLSLAKVK
ncbi:hypothetical protein BFP72_13510 [Reichenbachiella sp. 5M10]|nr:hypothetical protein BFP72_13510 [Reichenbachiella sp. 5M10]